MSNTVVTTKHPKAGRQILVTNDLGQQDVFIVEDWTVNLKTLHPHVKSLPMFENTVYGELLHITPDGRVVRRSVALPANVVG